MFGFLQGFALGLFVSCLPWLIVGLIEPRLAVPTERPTRVQVLLRYWLIVPFAAFLIWLTSLWGGLGPTLGGWLAGLVAIPLAWPIERAWRRRHRTALTRREQAEQRAEAERRRAELERQARERGIAELDPARPPTASDEVIQALWQMKRRLLAADRADLAVQTDRLYTRYLLVDEVLRDKFDEGELTFERARALVGEVSRAAIDDLDTMASVVRGVAGVDAAFVQRRLKQDRERMTADEVQALTRRLELIETTEDRVRELSARTEAAITALDDTAVAVSAVRTDRPRASVAADQALADLRRFVDRAHQYGHKD